MSSGLDNDPGCCLEIGCQREHPIRVTRSPLTGLWYAVTDYTLDGQGNINARRKHTLHVTDATMLEMGMRAVARLREISKADRDGMDPVISLARDMDASAPPDRAT